MPLGPAGRAEGTRKEVMERCSCEGGAEVIPEPESPGCHSTLKRPQQGPSGHATAAPSPPEQAGAQQGEPGQRLAEATALAAAAGVVGGAELRLGAGRAGQRRS